MVSFDAGRNASGPASWKRIGSQRTFRLLRVLNASGLLLYGVLLLAERYGM